MFRNFIGEQVQAIGVIVLESINKSKDNDHHHIGKAIAQQRNGVDPSNDRRLGDEGRETDGLI